MNEEDRKWTLAGVLAAGLVITLHWTWKRARQLHEWYHRY